MSRRRLTASAAVAALERLRGSDPEVDHCDADSILLRHADPDVAAAYERAVERAGAWWYA